MSCIHLHEEKKKNVTVHDDKRISLQNMNETLHYQSNSHTHNLELIKVI